MTHRSPDPPTRREPWYGWESRNAGREVYDVTLQSAVDAEPMLVLTIPPPGRPLAAGCAWFALGLCVGILLVALLMAVAPAIDAAPSSGQTTGRLVSPAPPAAQSGAPHVMSGPVASHPADGGTLRSRTAASAPSGITLSGNATWCGPTPTMCQTWGGDALYGAVPSFEWGDEPYRVRVRAEGRKPITVTVVSFCVCRDRRGVPTVIDLSPAAFRRLGPLSRGILRVTVEELPRTADDLRMMREVRDDEVYR